MSDNSNMTISADQAGKLRELIATSKMLPTHEHDFLRGWNDCLDWVLMMLDKASKGELT